MDLLDVHDYTESTVVVAFGPTAGEIIDCTTVDLLKHKNEDGLLFFHNIAVEISNREWMTLLDVEINEHGELHRNELNVIFVDPIP
ncbi:hypothetical protein I3842_14G089700 [Carya illinoinensis]|uniref:Uncharacterized protein n=1 Tax=Carya illinoinensis TaxID=32201 RepID=A0A922AIR8_CARIL|nr:hypothetical protein I3842_14G089700 [Carya illinoinensis]